VCNLHTLQSIHSHLHSLQSIHSHLHSLQSIHSSIYIAIYSIKRRLLVNWPQCGGAGGYRAHVIGWWRWRRRRPTRAVSTAVEETGMSGVDGGGDRQSRE
jgi:heme O synthase-like polyprenyltransferase